jgi:hypothetical protein
MKLRRYLIQRYINIEFDKNTVAETRRSVIRKQRFIAWLLKVFYRCEILGVSIRCRESCQHGDPDGK